MLILTRRIGERLMIGADIAVTVRSVRGRQVKLGIAAPANLHIDREGPVEREPCKIVADLHVLCMCSEDSDPCLYCEVADTIEAQLHQLELAQSDLAAQRQNFQRHAAAFAQFFNELGPYLGIEDGTVESAAMIRAAADIRQNFADLQAEVAQLRRALKRPDREAINAAPELTGKLAVVVYFNSEVQRDAFVDAARESMTNMRTVKVQ